MKSVRVATIVLCQSVSLLMSNHCLPGKAWRDAPELLLTRTIFSRRLTSSLGVTFLGFSGKKILTQSCSLYSKSLTALPVARGLVRAS